MINLSFCLFSGSVSHYGVTLALHRDLDGDGILDATDPIIGETATSSGGAYSFSNLPNGTYIVQVTDENNLLAGYTWTDGIDDTDNESQVTTYAVTINDSDVFYADFGFYKSGGPPDRRHPGLLHCQAKPRRVPRRAVAGAGGLIGAGDGWAHLDEVPPARPSLE